MHDVYVALGSNLDHPLKHILTAQSQLCQIPATSSISHSTCYRTKPLGGLSQPDYVNSVSRLKSALGAEEILWHLHIIEHEHGRRRGENRWQSRALDLDLLLYGDEIISSNRITIPHYAIAQRNFVIFPMLELNPDVVIPGIGKAADIATGLNHDNLIPVTAMEMTLAGTSHPHHMTK